MTACLHVTLTGKISESGFPFCLKMYGKITEFCPLDKNIAFVYFKWVVKKSTNLLAQLYNCINNSFNIKQTGLIVKDLWGGRFKN